MTRPSLRKRLSHRLKSAVYKSAALDAWLDDRLRPTGPSGLAQRSYHRLFPERASRTTVFRPADRSAAAPQGVARILSLVPPEDTGGANRPARLAAELYRRGFDIDWRWALEIYPWPQRRRPSAAGVQITHITDKAPLPCPSLVLIEAPHPAFIELLADVPAGVPIVYDQIDLWQEDLGRGWFSRDSEDILIRRADLLFASAQSLAADLETRIQRPCVLLPNAVDPQLLAASASHPRPTDLRPGKPCCVYIGALWGEWLDFAAISDLAAALPQAEIHLIGRRGDRPLPEAANIHFLGERSRESIPAYLAHAHIALAPFRSGPVASAVSPLKVFEALAMGCPVAATGLPEVADFAGVACSTTSLKDAVLRAAALEIPPATSAAFAASNSWALRVDCLLQATQEWTPSQEAWRPPL
ncbi:MAG: glycosyltransferase [Deltaproteobacteria bacterium]